MAFNPELMQAALANAQRRPVRSQVSFAAPGEPMPLTPPAPMMGGDQSRTEKLAAWLKGQQPVDYSSVQSPLEGLAKVGTSALQGWEQSKLAQGLEAQKKSHAQQVADALFPSTSGSADDPRKSKAMAILLENPTAFDAVVAKNMFPEPTEQWTPTTFNGLPGQVSSTTGKFDPFPTTGSKERPSKEDEYGVIRYLDTGEPVFKQNNEPPADNYSVDNPDVIPPPDLQDIAAGGNAAPTAPVERGPLFRGNTLQAQALNRMYIRGDITEEEALKQAIADEAFRMVTDPADRARLGISPNDHSLYQVDTDNKLYKVGDNAGLNIQMNDDGTVSSITQGGVDTTPGEQQARVKGMTKMFATMADDFPAADQFYQSTGALSSALLSADTGAWPTFSENFRKATGIALASNAGKLQAVNAMVDYLTPRMRVPGSGATSDMEMATFKNALPTLAGTPEGNALIATTLQKLGLRRLAMAKIAQDYTAGIIDSKTAITQLRDLPDAFDAFKAKQQQAGPVVIDGVTIEKIQ